MASPASIKSLVDIKSRKPDLAGMMGPQDDEPLDDLDDDTDDQDTAPADPLARGNELIGSWGELGSTLKEAGGEIVDGAHDTGADLLLSSIPDDAIEDVEKKFDRMPDDIQQCLAKNVAPLPPADINALAAALIDGHDGDTEQADQKLVAQYLTQLAQFAKENVDPADYADEKDDGDDDKGADGDGSGDGTPPPPPAAA